jgi:alanine racemase
VNRVRVALQRRSGTFRPPTLQTLPVAVTGPRCGCHGAPSAGRLGRSRGERAGVHEEQRAVRAAGLGSPLAHLASGMVTDPATHFGMVRVGAGLVGIDPSRTVEMHGASRLTAPIVHTTAVEAGTPVDYAGTYVTDRATHLSVLPVGYADGIPRERSPQACVEICGRRFPVVGQVSMDHIVIDTGAESFPVGTSVTVFGPDGGATPTLQEWARWAGTIPHTIVTGIGPRVKSSIA